MFDVNNKHDFFTIKKTNIIFQIKNNMLTFFRNSQQSHGRGNSSKQRVSSSRSVPEVLSGGRSPARRLEEAFFLGKLDMKKEEVSYKEKEKKSTEPI
jgi:hypothetical protein